MRNPFDQARNAFRRRLALPFKPVFVPLPQPHGSQGPPAELYEERWTAPLSYPRYAAGQDDYQQATGNIEPPLMARVPDMSEPPHVEPEPSLPDHAYESADLTGVMREAMVEFSQNMAPLGEAFAAGPAVSEPVPGGPPASESPVARD